MKEVRQDKQLVPADLRTEFWSQSKLNVACLFMKNIPKPTV